MLRSSIFALLTTSLVFAACANVGDAPQAEVISGDSTAVNAESSFSGTPFPLNPENSSVEWTAAKVTRRHEGGFGDFSGTLYLEGDAVSGIDMVIAAPSIFSDTERLTNHLKSDEFFDVEVYPEASFESTSIEGPIGEGDESETVYTVTGLLTMRGQTNQIAFPSTIAVNADSASASADFVINRQLWGLSYPGAPDDLIRDDVRIKLSVNAPLGAETGTHEEQIAD